jgi:hypothetical protein
LVQQVLGIHLGQEILGCLLLLVRLVVRSVQGFQQGRLVLLVLLDRWDPLVPLGRVRKVVGQVSILRLLKSHTHYP